jgi:hypothetical protein
MYHFDSNKKYKFIIQFLALRAFAIKRLYFIPPCALGGQVLSSQN